jgi:hypothetical protein
MNPPRHPRHPRITTFISTIKGRLKRTKSNTWKLKSRSDVEKSRNITSLWMRKTVG